MDNPNNEDGPRPLIMEEDLENSRFDTAQSQEQQGSIIDDMIGEIEPEEPEDDSLGFSNSTGGTSLSTIQRYNKTFWHFLDHQTAFNHFKKLRRDVQKQQVRQSSDLILKIQKSEELNEKIRNAIIMDNAEMLHNLNLSNENIIEFEWEEEIQRPNRNSSITFKYDFAKLACVCNSTNVLKHVYYHFPQFVPIDEKDQSKLLDTRLNNDSEHLTSQHLACFFGDLELLKVLHECFKAEFSKKSYQGLSVLHCAAYQVRGIVSIYYLKEVWEDFNINVRDDNDTQTQSCV